MQQLEAMIYIMWWDKVETWEDRRREMVERQIAARGVGNPRVLDAMRRVQRHLFVPDDLKTAAYNDEPQPVGWNQTISQPYIVALMLELLEPGPTDRILEIGTGSGYQTAILAEVGGQIYSMEIVPDLAERSRKLLLEQLEYTNVNLRVGDGYAGWPEKAPFDGIIVTAAPPEIPEALKEQIRPGGRLVIPVGKDSQMLLVVRRSEDGRQYTERTVCGVRFVPMTGGRSPKGTI